MPILLLHGWQSVPGGINPKHLSEHSHEIVNVKVNDDLAEAPATASTEFDHGVARRAGIVRESTGHLYGRHGH